ncbi:hypothetical protein K445DRAFT_204056 [Daldinia sp. EC12]|nr:hypothetical protein K445DRAFT_204056 [Daldinia sp. EC12]
MKGSSWLSPSLLSLSISCFRTTTKGIQVDRWSISHLIRGFSKLSSKMRIVSNFTLTITQSLVQS